MIQFQIVSPHISNYGPVIEATRRCLNLYLILCHYAARFRVIAQHVPSSLSKTRLTVVAYANTMTPCVCV